MELRLGRRATLLDRGAHEVELDTGERVGYAKLLLATGSSPRRLRLPGADLDGVHYLRRVEDSDRLREEIRDGGRIVVVGAGWIGLETAAAAREYGCDVTVIDPQQVPLVAALGSEMGAFFTGLHLRHGPPVAAKAMLGQQVNYDRLPYFFTDHYDVGMEFSGWFGPGGYDRLVTRGDVDGQSFHAFWVADDRVVAGMQVNLWDDGIAPVQELIRSRQPVDLDRLADTSVPLATQVVA
ncbi:NAD/ferredoxin-dependent reductase-like protein [Kribbella sp. VKM Ac-2527]|uniref:NAD/ferredoxin-dependent reductase-like protein n=1 Tax=Kribbella caucasensis TaxID=2512215 RepID=A0A4R6KDC6_9ACTN|nr:FAD-dependent oxidoreductase [Kribbella sp. VKM Ac-2527]TDO46882.1 NAD/ferredoxin-dependent reductase-like protein [Kribbella sp. VKM Ac-2527]